VILSDPPNAESRAPWVLTHLKEYTIHGASRSGVSVLNRLLTNRTELCQEDELELETITFEVDEHVATITLDRPEALNAFNRAMTTEMAYAWETVRDTDEIHAVVLQANGDRAFATGLDIREDNSWLFKANVWNNLDPGVTLSPKTHHKVWKPVVVAVHGLCAGGAQYFLNEADIIICSDDAEFFDPHANVGIVSALEPIGMLNRGVPLGDVLRWALMGNEERITAPTALRLGLVTEIVPRPELRTRARGIATSIARRNPKAVQGTIRAIWESLDMTRTIAIQNGLSYTEIGNNPRQPPAASEKQPPTHR
jgi:E-phenylitaconyl-CoA hydratase